MFRTLSNRSSWKALVPSERLLLGYCLAWAAARLLLYIASWYASPPVQGAWYTFGGLAATLDAIVTYSVGAAFDGILWGLANLVCLAALRASRFGSRRPLAFWTRVLAGVSWLVWLPLSLPWNADFLFQAVEALPSILPFLVAGEWVNRSLTRATPEGAAPLTVAPYSSAAPPRDS